MKSVAVHSHKGGVGKTTIAINLAVLLAKQGYKVCLIDADFSAPNLNTYFNIETTNYLNTYFDKKIQVSDVLHEVHLSDKIEGKLYLGLADPTANSINSMIRIDNRSAGNMLQKLLQLNRHIRGDPYNIDYLVLDTTPGIGLTTINSFVLTDNILFIIKLSNADIQGTIHMIGGLLDKLPNRSTLIANQIPASKIDTEEKKSYLKDLLTDELTRQAKGLELEFLGWIATDHDYLSTEFDIAISTLKHEGGKRIIFTLDKPEHPFSKSIEEVRETLFQE